MTESEDRTGLCTVRELIALMSEQGQDRGEMMVPVAGEHWHFVFTVARRGAAPVPLPGALEGRLAAAERRIAELEGRMPLGPIGPSFPPPPSWPWPVPIVTKTGAVICGGDTEVTKTGDCTAEIRDKRWLGTV